MALQAALHIIYALHAWLSQLQWYAPLSAQGDFMIAAGLREGRSTDPELPDRQLSWQNVGTAAMLLCLNIGLSFWLGLGLSTTLIVAAGRCIVQLTLLGMVLKQIFLTQNPVYIFGMAMILGTLAAFEVTFWRSKRRFPGMYAGTLVSIMGSALTVALFGNAYSLNMDPAYTATKFIPTIGMLFGNCMIGVSIGMGSVMDSLDIHRDRVEAMLCYGATRWEVIKPVAVDALRTALLPSITNMSITGLISIPGVMTGWILGGADVSQAARYQQIILFMISAATASSTLLSVLFCASVLVDRTPMLRLDRLVLTKGFADIASSKTSDSGKLSRESSRLAMRRAGCRPKSELYSSRNTSTASSSPVASRKDTLRTPSSMSTLHSRLSRLQSSSSSSQQLRIGGNEGDDYDSAIAARDFESGEQQPLLQPQDSEQSTAPDQPLEPHKTYGRHAHVDIEDISGVKCGEECRGLSKRRSKRSRPKQQQQQQKQQKQTIGSSAGESWKGRWCACCPYRSPDRDGPGGSTESPIVCYEFASDPTDILIPHPPGLACLLPGSASKNNNSNNSNNSSNSSNGTTTTSRENARSKSKQ